jgi:hypothetical protein
MATRLRRRGLSGQDIARLLRERQVEFAVADVGRPLLWIDPRDCYAFWKGEVRPHLAEPDSRIILDSFSSGYCYVASEWEDEVLGTSVVLPGKASLMEDSAREFKYGIRSAVRRSAP